MFVFIRFALPFVFLLGLGKAYAQSTDFCAKAKSIVEHIAEHHFSAKPIDTAYIKTLGNILPEIMDGKGLILNATDVQKMQVALEDLASNLENGDCVFVKEICTIFENKLKAKETILQELSDYAWKPNLQNFNSSKDENDAYPSPDAFVEHLKATLNDRLVYQYFDENPDSESVDLEKLKSMGASMIEQEICQLHSIQSKISQHVEEAILHAICIAHDPHTTWLSNQSSRKFLNAMANKNYGYGFSLDMNSGGNLEVKEIVPGSAVWNSNQINEGDILLSITLDDKKKQFDCNGMEEAFKLMGDDKFIEAHFEILKKSGKIIEVSLTKSKLESSDNVIQSFILEDEHKIGYICLPSFFTSDNYFELGCSDAIAKQLIKLKREGIEALIFDIRNNGGGAMDEALRVASMFINQGSIAINVSKDKEPVLIKDPSRGMLFQAPLIILQNQLSASAAELLSACIQDYNRGVIVGSPSFGKASIQTLFPLNYAQPDKMEFLKITIGKFYRVDGTSHQGKGVVPDIKLENLIFYDDFKEERFLTAYENDVVEKESYFKALPALPLEVLQANSQERLAQHDYFKKLRAINEELKNGVTTTNQLLTFTKLENMETEGHDEKNASFKIALPTYLSEHANTANAQNLLEQIKNDPYIGECFEIANDLIEME